MVTGHETADDDVIVHCATNERLKAGHLSRDS